MCRSSTEVGGVEIQENKLEIFVLARFLHHNILELKDLLILHSHFTDKETEVWGNCELLEVNWLAGNGTGFLSPPFTKCVAQGSSRCAEVLGEEAGLW